MLMLLLILPVKGHILLKKGIENDKKIAEVICEWSLSIVHMERSQTTSPDKWSAKSDGWTIVFIL